MTAIDHERNGLESAIPPCCRAWFHVWCAFVDAWGDRLRLAYVEHHPFMGWGYSPCPGCRQCDARVVVRITRKR